jgi:hypothetical protein
MEGSTEMASNQQPSFTAYAVTKRGEGQDDWWTPIGAAWPHGDGLGFNIQLQTLPLDGKIVLRPPKADDERDKQTIREANDRRSGQQRRGQ